MSTENAKINYFQDPIYNGIEVPELCLKFINTMEFQRLKRVKQLGMTYEVYPSGIHTRAEHSLGVMHISGVFYDSLIRNSSQEWSCYHEYKILIQLAGLLHDIGHGPFSHIFEEAMKIRNISFCHEHHSLYIINRINKRLGLLSEEQVEIIGNMILGKRMDNLPAFLFQIVANKDSGLDTDKMDYLRRDAYHIGKNSINIDYIIRCAQIDPTGEVSYLSKAEDDIRTLFANRKNMYKTVYFHNTVKKIDRIMVCALGQLDIDTNDPDCFLKLDDFSTMYKLRYVLEHDVINCLDNRELNHNCEKCPKVKLVRVAKLSSDVDGDPLRYIRFYDNK